MLRVDVALGQDLEGVVLGSCGDLASALRVFVAGLRKRRLVLRIFLVQEVAGIPVFLEFRRPRRVLALLLELDGQFLGHLHFLIMEIAHIQAHDVLVFFERSGVVSFLYEIDLPEGALA